MIPRTGLVTLSHRDLADFGFFVSDAPGLFGSLAATSPVGTVLGAAGHVVLGEEVQLSAGDLPMRVAFLGTSTAAVQAALDALQGWCALGPIELWHKLRPAEVQLCTWGGSSLFVPGKLFNRSALIGTVTFRRLHPYALERWSRHVTATGTGSANRVAIETGTAGSHLLVWLVGATNPTITHRRFDGTILRTSTLTGIAGETVVLDSQLRAVWKWTGGVPADTPAALTLGHGFFVAQPGDGNVAQQRWQTLETSSGVLHVDARRAWVV